MENLDISVAEQEHSFPHLDRWLEGKDDAWGFEVADRANRLVLHGCKLVLAVKQSEIEQPVGLRSKLESLCTCNDFIVQVGTVDLFFYFIITFVFLFALRLGNIDGASDVDAH